MSFLPSSQIKKSNQSGQALLVVLLSMAVILTVVLSVVSRSVTDVAITTYEEEALRAFSAAEAGVEKALLNPVPQDPGPVNPDPLDIDVSYDLLVDDPTEDDGKFKYPGLLTAGEVATFWLVEHDANGDLTCAGGTCFSGSQINICVASSLPQPAIETLIFYDSTLKATNSNNYKDVQVYRAAFGNLGGTSSPITSDPQCNSLLGSPSYGARIDVNTSVCGGNCDQGELIMAKVRMYYSPGVALGIYVPVGQDLPAQGVQISSTGVAGDSTRKINVFQTYPENPTLFDSAVFSMQDLVKP